MKQQQSKTDHGGRSIQSFKTIFTKAAYSGSYEQTFDDFMTMVICAYTRNIETGLSHYEEEYLRVIEPYKKNNTLKYFPELMAEMILYMEEHKDGSEGNDLLGTFFEKELSHGRNGQFFTPFPICIFMASITRGEETKRVNVLDPACGSGRMLLAFGKGSTLMHGYYGIDIDSRCVKMTALNMFLNGLFGEVMCGNALAKDDFRFGYKISLVPFGIFKIENKEQSTIWQIQKNQREQAVRKPPDVSLPSEQGTTSGLGSQLELF